MSEHIVTVFRSRLRPEALDEYQDRAPHMDRLARSMPGFLDVKSFEALDGERVTIVTFQDRDSHDAWRLHPEHVAAQQEGIADFYLEYSIQVAEVTRSSCWRRAEG